MPRSTPQAPPEIDDSPLEIGGRYVREEGKPWRRVEVSEREPAPLPALPPAVDPAPTIED